MRRLIDVLIAAALLVAPALFVASSSVPAPTAAAQSTHYLALSIKPASVAGPGDPGTL